MDAQDREEYELALKIGKRRFGSSCPHEKVKNGRSQAIRLPKEFGFEGKEIYIRKVGHKVILSAKPESWKDFFFFW